MLLLIFFKKKQSTGPDRNTIENISFKIRNIFKYPASTSEDIHSQMFTKSPNIKHEKVIVSNTGTRSGISTGREEPVAPVPEPVLPFRD